MRITETDYQALRKSVVRALLVSESQADYLSRGLGRERYNWDMLWKSDFSLAPLYAYLTDDHISTALRRIVAEFEADTGRDRL